MEKLTKVIINFNNDNGVRTMSIDGVTSAKYLTKDNKELIPFINQITKEVKKYPKSKQKKIMKQLQVSTLTLITMMHFTATSKAQTLSVYKSEDKNDLLPPEITDILKKLILACEGIAILLACIFLIMSGIYWMVGNKAKSKQWTEDIIKGLGLTILAPVTILLLVKIVSTVFKNTPIFEAFF